MLMGYGIRYQKLLITVLILIVSAGVYSNILHNEFLTDDIFQIKRNERIQSLRYLPDIFLSSVWEAASLENESNYYRPLMYVYFMVGYKFSGLEPWGYHLTSIFIHAVNSILVFFVSCLLFEKRHQEEGFPKEGNRFSPEVFPFISAVFFSVNTINTEAVNWAAAVPELSFTMFFLLSLYFYIKGRLIISSVMFFLSLLSKETAIVLLLFLFTYDTLFKKGPLSPVSLYLRRYSPSLLAMIAYFGLRTYALGNHVATVSEQTTYLTGYQYLINIPLLAGEYIKMLVFPADLIYFNYLRFSPYSISEPRTVVSILLFTCFALLIFWIRRRKPVIFISVLLMLAPLLPVFYLGWTLKFPLYENRYLYLPSAGYGIFISALILDFKDRLDVYKGSSRTVLKLTQVGSILISVILLISAVLYSVGTVRRNYVWRDNYTLWNDNVRKDPNNKAAHIGFGTALAKKGLIDEALAEYRRALEVDLKYSYPNIHNNSKVHNNIGVVYALKGEFNKAIEEFERALELNPNNIDARWNLEKALQSLGASDASTNR